jgi:hypothetical protein
MTAFSATLTNGTVRLPQSRGCYVSRRILAPPPLWLQKHTDLRANDFAHSPDLWHQPRLAKVTCDSRWRLCGITPAIITFLFFTAGKFNRKKLNTLHPHCTWHTETGSSPTNCTNILFTKVLLHVSATVHSHPQGATVFYRAVVWLVDCKR